MEWPPDSNKQAGKIFELNRLLKYSNITPIFSGWGFLFAAIDFFITFVIKLLPMRKLIKNQSTGHFRQIVHCSNKYGGDKWSFSGKRLRCSSNDTYESSQPSENKSTFVCTKCLLSIRRRRMDSAPICHKCNCEMKCFGMRFRLPKKRKLRMLLKAQ